MKPIPSDILTKYEAVLKKRVVPVSRHVDYRKWLLYYLDFRGKYTLSDSKSEHVRLFIEKLQKKNQTPEQQKQAAHVDTETTVKATIPSAPRSESEFSRTDPRVATTLIRVCV